MTIITVLKQRAIIKNEFSVWLMVRKSPQNCFIFLDTSDCLFYECPGEKGFLTSCCFPNLSELLKYPVLTFYMHRHTHAHMHRLDFCVKMLVNYSWFVI